MFRILVLGSFFLIKLLIISSNENGAYLISKYAKVSRWGAGNATRQETGRSSKGQDIGRPRSSSNFNNVKNQVVYQYPVYKQAHEEEVEKIPGIGEVIQDRFQVRPYFGYGKTKDADVTYLPPAKPAVSTPVRQPPPPSPPSPSLPAVSFTVPSPPIAPPQSLPSPVVRPADFNTPPSSSTSKVPSNLYDSPFTSYNPPDSSNPGESGDIYPPNSSSTNDDMDNSDAISSNGDSYSNIPQTDGGPYAYQANSNPPAPPPKPMEYSSISDSKPHHNFYENGDMIQPNGYTYQAPGMGSNSMHSHEDDERPSHPPKSINDIYYPPDFPKDQIPNAHDHQHHHDMNNQGMDAHGVDAHDMDGHGMVMDSAPPDTQNGHDMTMDLVPPVDGHDLPKYLYDDHHYDHHVYEEVHHTSTPEPEKKRVSTTNYSYYYLGRKLWYIPLYFSIYFMVYVTALIIKSIARHKVTLRNDWIAANSRSAREMTLDQIKAVDSIHRNVSNALDKAGKLYAM